MKANPQGRGGDESPQPPERAAADPSSGGEVDAQILLNYEAPGHVRHLDVKGGKKYAIHRVIAEGGMGVIFEAEDLRCRRAVALKILSKKLSQPAEDIIRFIAEAQITSQLEHPNIVPIHELGVDLEGNAFYTMKHVRGHSLAEVLIGIRKGNVDFANQFPLARLLNVFQKVCDAAAFAHARGVVHRDLKPQNVMIGSYGEVLLMDWGLAKKIGATDPWEMVDARPDEPAPAVQSVRDDYAGDGLTALTTAVMGSPGFMAPEQILRRGNVDARADIYGLGAILYSILTLRATVSEKDHHTAVRRILAGDFPPPYAFNQMPAPGGAAPAPTHAARHPAQDGTIPEVLSDIAMKALAKDPEDRYRMVKDLQEDLHDYQSGLVWVKVADEDFRNPGFEDRWDVVGGEWSIQDGELCIRGGEPQLLILKRALPLDVRIEFECRQEGEFLNDVSCFMNAFDLENKSGIPFTGYEFKYGGFDNSMNLLSRHDVRLWSEVASPIVRDRVYRVRATRVKSLLRLDVNNREVFRVFDANSLSSPERVRAGLFGWRATTRYTRIRVYALQAPWTSDLLDFTDQQAQKGNYDMAIPLYREVVQSGGDAGRIQRATRGLDSAVRAASLRKELPELRAALERAWPGAHVLLQLDRDNLTVEAMGGGITNLEPLRGMPLRALNCRENRITSLEPLRGMPLASLDCAGNPIASLDPLRGMPLTKLNCEYCAVENLDGLRGMPLETLVASGNPCRSLEALRGIQLTNLAVSGTDLEDLEPLRGMPLTRLYCSANRIRDLGPLEGMPLLMLNAGGNEIEDLEPLRGAPIRTLHLGENRIKSLEPLRGMQLRTLSCTGNHIASLEPLRGMPLDELICGNNTFRSLEAFVESPPRLFAYDSPTLDAREIERASACWAAQPDRAHLARQAAVLLASRRHGKGGLRSLATVAGGRAYLYVPIFLTWQDARSFAEEAGGHLLVIHNDDEQRIVESVLTDTCWWCWMGLLGTERGLEAVTGEPVRYLHLADRLQFGKPGPKVFAGFWLTQDERDAENAFIIQWGIPSDAGGG